MDLTFDVKINAVDEAKFLEYAQEEVLKQMEKRLIGARARVGDTIYNYLRQAINDSPEVQALEQGDLRFDLGVKPEEVASVKDGIIQIIADSTRLTVNRYKTHVDYEVSMIKSGYADLLGMAGAEFESIHGFHIPWLQWLLLSGHQQVVKSYHVKYKDYPAKGSRSGGAIMVRGGNYSIVPSQFTGVADDNFITRSLDKMFPEIEKVLIDILS